MNSTPKIASYRRVGGCIVAVLSGRLAIGVRRQCAICIPRVLTVFFCPIALPRPRQNDEPAGDEEDKARQSAMELRMEAEHFKWREAQQQRLEALAAAGAAPPRLASPAPQQQKQRQAEQQRRGRSKQGTADAAASAAERLPRQPRTLYTPPVRPWMVQQLQRSRNAPQATRRMAHLLPPAAAPAANDSSWEPPQNAAGQQQQQRPQTAARPARQQQGPQRRQHPSGFSDWLPRRAGHPSVWTKTAVSSTRDPQRPLSAPPERRPASALQPTAAGAARPLHLDLPHSPGTAAAGVARRPFTAAATTTTPYGSAPPVAAAGDAGDISPAWLALFSRTGGGGGAAAQPGVPAYLLHPRPRPKFDTTPLLPSQHLCGGAAPRPASPPQPRAGPPPAGGALDGPGAAGAAPAPALPLPYLRDTFVKVRHANALCARLRLQRRYELWEASPGGGVGGAGRGGARQLLIEVWEPEPAQPPAGVEGGSGALLLQGVTRRLQLAQFLHHYRQLQQWARGERPAGARGPSAAPPSWQPASPQRRPQTAVAAPPPGAAAAAPRPQAPRRQRVGEGGGGAPLAQGPTPHAASAVAGVGGQRASGVGGRPVTALKERGRVQ
jgi:hypothetical protein